MNRGVGQKCHQNDQKCTQIQDAMANQISSLPEFSSHADSPIIKDAGTT